MKLVQTLLLIAIALALGLWAYYGENYLDEQARLDTQPQRVLSFNPMRVDTMIVMCGGDTIVASKQPPNIWKIEKPVIWPGNAQAWGSILRDMHTTTVIRGMKVSGDSLMRYGLNPPLSRVILKFKDTFAEPETLDVGRETPGAKSAYIHRPGSDSVFVVSNKIKESAVKRLFSLRDVTLIHMGKDFVRKIVLSVKGKKDLTLVRKAKDDWNMTSPMTKKASRDSIELFLSHITSARAVRILDKPGKLSDYGLDPPMVRARFVLDIGGKAMDKTLFIGKAKTGPTGSGVAGAIFAKDEVRGSIMQISGNLYNHVTRSPNGYRDRRLTKFRRADVNRVSWVKPTGTTTVAMDASRLNWRFVKPDTGRVKRPEVNYTVAYTDDIRAVKYVDRAGDYGLSKPRLTVKVYKDATLVGQVAFGNRAGKLIYARGDYSKEVFLVDYSMFTKMNKTVKDLREKRTRPSMSPDMLKRLRKSVKKR
jgi:hypothetical protein